MVYGKERLKGLSALMEQMLGLENEVKAVAAKLAASLRPDHRASAEPAQPASPALTVGI